MSNSIQDSGSAAALINSLNAANSSLSKTPASSAGSANDTQDRFLKLLVTQMKNQDPLNPLDNAQVTSQMAQLSTVSGIDKLNSTLQALSNSMAVGQSMSATNMIGHGVLVPGSILNLTNGQQAVGGVELTQPADSLKITIQDAAGNTIRTMQVGAQDAGALPFAWDGKTDAGTTAADGSYKFKAEAVLSGNTTFPATLAFGKVNAVTPGAQGATLSVGQVGDFALPEVKLVM